MASSHAQCCVAARYSLQWHHLPVCDFEVRRSLMAGDVAGVATFHGMLLPIRCGLQLAIASEQARLIAADARTTHATLRLEPPRQLRRHLSVALLRGSANANVDRLAALLMLDRQCFSTNLYTTALDAQSLRAIRHVLPDRSPARHTPLHPSLTDGAAARLLASHDIVLDASGHTAGNRLGALALRPAAVATAVLGYPGSYGGARLVDYLTVDRVVMGPSTCARCVARAERLCLLPTTYQVSPIARAAAGSTAPREGARADDVRSGRGQLGAATALMIGSFTRVVRWHPHSFELWAALLLRTGASTALWLLADDAAERRRARAELAAMGIFAARRMRFGGFEHDKAVHAARHGWLAACVDTTPLYGSHTTAADALREAVPLLTLPSEAWASRVGASVGAASGALETAAASTRALVDASAALLAAAPEKGQASARGGGLGGALLAGGDPEAPEAESGDGAWQHHQPLARLAAWDRKAVRLEPSWSAWR